MSLLQQQQLMMAQAAASSGDPHWANVFSLAYMDGANGSTSFPDQISGRLWTPSGGADISTAQNPFGAGSSGAFATGRITTNTKTDWTFLHDGSTPWTIDFWANITALGTRMFFGTNAGSSANIGIACWSDATGRAKVFITSPTSILNLTSSSTLFSAGTWYFISVQLNADHSLSFYLNGSLITTTGVISGFSASAPSLALQVGDSGNSNLPLDGFMSNWRVTKGVARYSGNFTPPPAPFPNHA